MTATDISTKNWIVRYYDKKDKLIGSHTIKDRTENEAENEAIADMPYECEDWTLVPADNKVSKNNNVGEQKIGKDF